MSPRDAAPGVACRAERDDDEPFLRALYFSVRADELALTGWPDDGRRAFADAQFDAQHRHYAAHYAGAERLIVERDGAPVGRLYLHRSPRELRVMDVSLLPAVRGRGIGAALLAGVQADAASSRRSVTVHVDAGSPARRFYARLGFEPVGAAGFHERLSWRPASDRTDAS